jgi:hypothetical protein
MTARASSVQCRVRHCGRWPGSSVVGQHPHQTSSPEGSPVSPLTVNHTESYGKPSVRDLQVKAQDRVPFAG